MNFIKNTLMLTLLFAGQAGFASQAPKTVESTEEQTTNSAEQKYSMEQAIIDFDASLKKQTNKEFDLYVQNLQKMNLQLKDVINAFDKHDIGSLQIKLEEWCKNNRTDEGALLLTKLIDNGLDVYANNSVHSNFIEHAIRWCTPLLQALIACKNIDFNKPEKNLTSFLKEAIYYDNPIAVKLFIQAGADPNLFDGEYPLTLAYKWKMSDNKHLNFNAVIKELILGGADIQKAIKDIQNNPYTKRLVLAREGNIYSHLANTSAAITNSMCKDLSAHTNLLQELTQIVLAYAGHPTKIVYSKTK